MNTETTSETSKYPSPEHATPSEQTPDKVARLITELGVGWAKYGLSIGRMALQQSARALETTGELLGAIATRVEQSAAPKPPVDAPVEVKAEIIDDPKK